MSSEEVLQSVSLNADDTLAQYTGVPNMPGSPALNYGKQYSFVKVTGANQVGLATAGGPEVVGVLQNKPQVTGQAATVGIYGITNVMSGGAFAAGDKLDVDADGHAVKASGATFVAIALQDAGGALELAPALLRCN